MKNNKIYPDGTFEDIVSFPFNTDRIVAIVVGVVFLSGIFFLATIDNESLAPKKFANEKQSLSQIWSEENLRSTDGQFSFPINIGHYSYPFNFYGWSWNLLATEYNPETKQFRTKKMWSEGYYE
jgi:hypothetical protein